MFFGAVSDVNAGEGELSEESDVTNNEKNVPKDSLEVGKVVPKG